jgi:hypothetical protein
VNIELKTLPTTNKKLTPFVQLMLRFSALLVWLQCLACVLCIPSPTIPLKAPAIRHTELISLVINSQNTVNLAPIKRLCESLLQTRNPNSRAINLFFTLPASTSEEIENYVYSFSWPYGKKNIRVKVLPTIGQINSAVESWYPAHNLNYGLFLSDNMEVSPLWLMWVDMIMVGLKGNSSIFKTLSERLMGISLGSIAKVDFSGLANRIDYFYGEHKQFHLMQMPNLYTVLFFPQSWRELFNVTKNSVAVTLDTTILSDEVHSGWNKYLYDYMRVEGKFICFPHFPDDKSFAAVQQGKPARLHPQLQYSSELAFL